MLGAFATVVCIERPAEAEQKGAWCIYRDGDSGARDGDSLRAIGRGAAHAAPLLPDDTVIVDSQDREVLYRVLGVQRLLNLQDAIQLLRSEVKRAGSQRAFARKAGVNVSVLVWSRKP